MYSRRLDPVNNGGGHPPTASLLVVESTRRVETEHCQLCRTRVVGVTRLHANIDQLDTRRDLYNLSRTCRALEGTAMARLYHNVDLSLPEAKALCTPILRPPVTQSVRHITIRNGKARKSHAETVSQHEQVNQLLDIIPAGRLISFL